jgi:hypothetical protein
MHHLQHLFLAALWPALTTTLRCVRLAFAGVSFESLPIGRVHWAFSFVLLAWDTEFRMILEGRRFRKENLDWSMVLYTPKYAINSAVLPHEEYNCFHYYEPLTYSCIMRVFFKKNSNLFIGSLYSLFSSSHSITVSISLLPLRVSVETSTLFHDTTRHGPILPFLGLPAYFFHPI